MNKLILKTAIFVVALYMSVSGAFPGLWHTPWAVAAGDRQGVAGVTIIEMTGTLTPYTSDREMGLHSVVLRLGEKDWLFNYSKLNQLIEGESPSWLVLHLSEPRELRVVGNEMMTKDLTTFGMGGKLITVKGAYYPSSSMLYLGGVCKIDAVGAGAC